ncbi:MAG: hypothetical protein KTR32_11770 [Granulosicoccus sp.]|nr:hypothetical protein [Granulosicoccus sp.]
MLRAAIGRSQPAPSRQATFHRYPSGILNDHSSDNGEIGQIYWLEYICGTMAYGTMAYGTMAYGTTANTVSG